MKNRIESNNPGSQEFSASLKENSSSQKKNTTSTRLYAFTFLIALFGMSTWLLGEWQIATLGHGYVPMAPSTGLLLMMLSSSAILCSVYPLKKWVKHYSRFTIICTGVVSLIVLSLHISGSWHYIEKLLYLSPEKITNIPIGRMSPLTAIVFLLNAVSIIPIPLLNIKKDFYFKTRQLPNQVSAFLSFIVCIMVFMGYAADAPLLYGGKTVPMALLTAVSFIILNMGFLLSSGPESWCLSAFTNHYSDRNFSYKAIISFICISIIIGSVGVLFLKSQIREEKNKIRQQLSIISDLKTRQIADWYEERITDAKIILNTPALQTQISHALKNQSNDQDKNDLLKWMETFGKEGEYPQIILYDEKGIARLWTLKPDEEILENDDITSFWEAIHKKKIVLGSLHIHETKENFHKIHMPIFIPAGIYTDSDKSAEGALMLLIDPYKYLYPLIQTWPINSSTAETLLVKQEGSDVLFLNELKHMKNTALSFKLAMRPDLPAALAIKGQKGIIEGIDYRGINVLAAINNIPRTPWFIVSKIDINEVYAPIIFKTWIVMGVILTLILLTAMFFFISEKQRSVEFYRNNLEKEQENLKNKNALLESEKQFRSIFNQAAVGICYVDLNGRFIKINQRFCEIIGYTEDELLDLTFQEITHPDDLEADISKVNDMLTGTIEVYSLEKRYIRKNKDIIWINLTVALDRFSDASPKSFISVVEDITESKLSRIKLKKSEERYATTLAAVNDGLWDWHVPSGNAFFSDHYYSILGYESQEFTANYDSWRRLVHSEDIYRFEQNLKGRLVIGEGFSIDLRMKMKSNEWKWVSIRGKVVEMDEKGAVKRMMGTMSDISERKMIENKIVEEKERLHVTLRSIGDGVITTDTSAKITLMNKIAEDLTGWKINEAIDRHLDEILCIFNEHSKIACENPALKVLTTGERIEFESNTILINKDGREIRVEDSAAPIRDSDSKIVGAVIVFRDITEKHKTDEAIQNAQKLESLSILAGGIAHDFNNLLGGIFGYLDMALEFASERDFKGTTTTISSALSVFERARDLTQQLLTFSKGGAPIRKTESISKLVRDSVSFALTGSNIAMIFEIPNNIWNSYFDKNQMGQVIDNIVINARQAMTASGGIVTASLSNIGRNDAPSLLKQNSYVKISIRDNGPGIPKEHISHIFDPFFTTKQQGNGLGLATCYSIIKRHDGLIEVESEKGRGTTFHIYLPASTYDTEIIQTETRQKFNGQGRILVMDDELPMLKVTSAMLGRFGYNTVTASNGDEAVSIIKQATLGNQNFFAAILDLTVPGGKGGKDIVQEIKLIDPFIKIIASSGYSGDAVMSNPEKFGFTAGITKPFRISDLAKLLKNLSI